MHRMDAQVSEDTEEDEDEEEDDVIQGKVMETPDE